MRLRDWLPVVGDIVYVNPGIFEDAYPNGLRVTKVYSQSGFDLRDTVTHKIFPSRNIAAFHLDPFLTATIAALKEPDPCSK